MIRSWVASARSRISIILPSRIAFASGKGIPVSTTYVAFAAVIGTGMADRVFVRGDADLKLVSVSENAKPCKTQRCPAYPSKGPAKYVLELNAGKAAELGVQPGDQLELRLK